jgi:ATP-binding cassette subfamily B protein
MCYTPKLYSIDSFFWILIMSLPVVPGLIIRAFFDKLAGNSSLGFSLWGIIALLFVTDLGQIAVLFTGRFTKTQHRFTMSALLQRNLLVRLFSRPGALPLMVSGEALQTVSLGEAISYFRDDADQVQDNIASTSEVIGAGVLAVCAIALLLSINARITLLAFLPLAVMVVVVEQAQKRIKRYRQASRQSTEKVTGFIGEIFSAVQAIKIAGAEKQVLSHFRQVNEQRRQMMVKDQLFTAMLKSAFENLVSIGTGLILIMAAQSMQAGVGTLSVGDFALFIYYLPYVTFFLEFLGGFLALSKQTEVSFERMEALLSSVETEKMALCPHSPVPSLHSQKPLNPKTQAYTLVAHNPLYINNLWGRKPELPKVDQPRWDDNTRLHELTASNLTYHYPDTGRGISAVNLTIRRGSLTVITGRIGSGKTTLLRVLLGLLPLEAGAIYWNGRQVDDPAKFFVPPRSAYTPQIPKFFSYSLRENILLGFDRGERDMENAMSQRLRFAIAMAVFEQDVAAMSEGLDTLVGPKGVRLSGGQLQRAAAARMFVRQPELLVFDDLSSALDVETEQKLWSRLFAAKSDSNSAVKPYWQASEQASVLRHLRKPDAQQQSADGSETDWTPTCLVVSHRLPVLRRANTIIVLNEGRVEAQGKFDDLRGVIPNS